MLIDAHQHFWPDPAQGPAAPQLLSAPFVLRQRHLPDDLKPQLDAAGVRGTILVQGYPQSDENNHWYFELARRTPWVWGVVAWVDLTDRDRMERQLDQLQAQPKWVGVRHIVDEEPDPDWIARPAVIASLRELARRNVNFDLLCNPGTLGSALRMLDAVDGLRVVVDHLAKPQIATRAWEPWATDLARIAAYPHVVCKLSGLITQADHRAWRPEDMATYVNHALEVFGADRMIFGSDWPVCRLAGEYDRVVALARRLVSELPAHAQAQIFGGNAARFYLRQGM